MVFFVDTQPARELVRDASIARLVFVHSSGDSRILPRLMPYGLGHSQPCGWLLDLLAQGFRVAGLLSVNYAGETREVRVPGVPDATWNFARMLLAKARYEIAAHERAKPEIDWLERLGSLPDPRVGRVQGF